MVPTIPWMRENFQKYNRQYFGGKLPLPQLEVEKMPNEWGRFELPGAKFRYSDRRIINRNGNGIIKLTGSYNRQEKAVISTLLHEMVHEYVYLIMGIYPENAHGREFMSIANRINADGWNIADGVQMTNTDTEAKDIKQRALFFVVYDQNANNKWQVGRADENGIGAFCASAQRINGKIWVYECASKKLLALNSDPSLLLGFGGTTYQEAATKLARYCGERPAVFSIKNMKRIK